MSVDHYENFPVASWLCPPRLRPAVGAIYWFARTADDLADEGDASAEERLHQLADYGGALDLAAEDREDPRQRWPQVFTPLRSTLRTWGLDARYLRDLLSAFEQDVRNPAYPDRTTLLDYCRRSANPVGRLLLQLYGLHAGAALAESDAICTALQLINFWQDLGADRQRGRCYVPADDLQRHGLTPEGLLPGRDTDATRALMRELCHWSEQLMHDGAPLAPRVPGRSGWELRLVVQGGLRILEKIRRMDYACLSHRPTLQRRDALPLLWRAATMQTAELHA